MNCAVNECGGNLTVFHFGESESAVESCVESCGSFTLGNSDLSLNCEPQKERKRKEFV